MRKLLVLIVFLISTVNASEKPVKVEISCPQVNDCNIKLTPSQGWKVYAHDENNLESLNFNLNLKKSKNIQAIAIDWTKQKFYSEDFMGMKIDYYESGSPIPFKISTSDNNYDLSLDIQYAACSNYCTVFKETVNFSNDMEDTTLLQMIILAFIGGLILNFMPCVLPVVWLKVIYISKKCKANTRKTRLEILYISLGIVTSFIILATTTALMRSLGEAVGWGMQFQQPLFVALIAIVTGLSALNMLDIVKINPPQYLQKILDKSDGMVRDFLHGIFLVLLATPCTAPFLGTAIAFCLLQPIQYIFAIYLSVAIGLATPYILLATFPQTLRLLPKPGKWMDKFKFIAAVPFIGTSIWMLYILTNQSLTLAFIVSAVIFIITLKNNIKLSIIGFAIFTTLLISSNFTNGRIGWEEFRIEKISHEVKLGKTVLVNITSDWCITCKINEKMVLSDSKTIDQLKEMGTTIIVGDYTSNSQVISDYIKENKRSGIPLSVVYGPKAPKGIVLPVIFTKQDLIEAINRAKES
jgi:suppressor for copper-sensitivity B